MPALGNEVGDVQAAPEDEFGGSIYNEELGQMGVHARLASQQPAALEGAVGGEDEDLYGDLGMQAGAGSFIPQVDGAFDPPSGERWEMSRGEGWGLPPVQPGAREVERVCHC